MLDGSSRYVRALRKADWHTTLRLQLPARRRPISPLLCRSNLLRLLRRGLAWAADRHRGGLNGRRVESSVECADVVCGVWNATGGNLNSGANGLNNGGAADDDYGGPNRRDNNGNSSAVDSADDDVV